MSTENLKPENGKKNRLRFEFLAYGYEYDFKRLKDFDPEDFDSEDILSDLEFNSDSHYCSFGHYDDDFDIIVYVNDKEVWSREKVELNSAEIDFDGSEVTEDECPVCESNGLRFKDVTGEVKYCKKLLDLDFCPNEFFRAARERNEAYAFAAVREKGAFTLGEDFSIEIAGDFDISKLRLLSTTTMPEPIDDLMGPGVVGIEYDGVAYPFSIDGNVWGLSHWAIVDTTGDIAAWDGEDD